MAEEVFDVVNDRNEVVGQMGRSEVHRRRLNHRAVHILVYNQQQQIFLQKRSLQKECFPGTWDSSASGHVSTGETYDLCALRELEEELGLVLPHPPQRLFQIPASEETGHEFIWVYRCRAEGPFTLHPEEIEQGAWHSSAAIDEWLGRRPGDFAGGFRVLWKTLNRRVR